jgi:hypothetical protein
MEPPKPVDPPDPLTRPLASLRWHWGSAYDIRNPLPRVWIAERRDTRDALRADSPVALRDLIVADYTARPVPRDASPARRPPLRRPGLRPL